MSGDINRGIGQFVRSLIRLRGMTQAEVARRVDTSAQNLNDRIRKNTFTSEMLMNLSRVLNVNILDSFDRYSHGAPVESVVSEQEFAYGQQAAAKTTMSIELTPEEVKEIMLKQARTIEALNSELQEVRKAIVEVQKELASQRK